LEGGVFRLFEAEVKRFDEVYTSTAVPVFQEERLHTYLILKTFSSNRQKTSSPEFNDDITLLSSTKDELWGQAKPLVVFQAKHTSEI
jgi:hypothetical protein